MQPRPRESRSPLTTAARERLRAELDERELGAAFAVFARLLRAGADAIAGGWTPTRARDQTDDDAARG